MRTYFRRIFPALLALVLVGAVEVYAQTATVVTQSGQRFRGQVVSMGDSGYGGSDAVVIRENGRERRIPIQDVALIDFTGSGNAPRNETMRANRSGDGLVVLRDGRTVAGRVMNLEAYNNQAVVSGQFGDRTIPLNQVARVYVGSSTSASSQYGYGNSPYYDQNGYGNSGGYEDSGQPSFGRARTVTIPTSQAWSNSGIDVRRGDVIHFRASGNVTLSHNPGDYGTPSGANDGRLAGNSPLSGVTGGMLIGRVGNSQPFAIGAESEVTMPASGRLYLGVNDDFAGDNSGNFVVEMVAR